MIKKLVLLVVAIGVIGGAAIAQETSKEAPKQEEGSQAASRSAYKLQFVLRELQDGKVVNTRDYAGVIQENSGPVDLKIGSKIPVKTTEKELTYIDIGTSIRCWELKALPPVVALNCTVEMSTLALPEQQVQNGISTPPVLNQIRSETHPVVEEGKQAVISSMDDPISTKRYEIAITVNKAK
jgi:hypothetical protein